MAALSCPEVWHAVPMGETSHSGLQNICFFLWVSTTNGKRWRPLGSRTGLERGSREGNMSSWAVLLGEAGVFGRRTMANGGPGLTSRQKEGVAKRHPVLNRLKGTDVPVSAPSDLCKTRRHQQIRG